MIKYLTYRLFFEKAKRSNIVNFFDRDEAVAFARRYHQESNPVIRKFLVMHNDSEQREEDLGVVEIN